MNERADQLRVALVEMVIRYGHARQLAGCLANPDAAKKEQRSATRRFIAVLRLAHALTEESTR